MLPRVAVILVTHNGRQYLPDCLSSLKLVDYPQDRWSLVLVDNNSTDGSVDEVARHFPTALVFRQTSNTGFAAGNNVGLRSALDHGFAYAYLLNQDTAVAPQFLSAAVAVAEGHPDAAAVQSKLLLHGTALVNSWGNEIHFLGFGFAGGHRQPDRPMAVSEIAYPSGAAVLLRTSVLREVGLLDETLFMYHEDLELGWRLWLAGYRCLLAPNSVVYHKYDFSRSLGKYYWMERNRYLVLLTHYRTATLLLLWPISLLVDAGLFLQAARAGYLRQVLAAQLHVLKPSTWRWLVRRRQAIRRLRQRSDRDIVRHFACTIEFQDLPKSPLMKFGNRVMRAYWRIVRPMIQW